MRPGGNRLSRHLQKTASVFLQNCYRILEVPSDSSDVEADGVEIGQYQSAYQAMEDMKREFLRSKSSPRNWYLVGPNRQILLSPMDMYDYDAF